MAQNFTDDVFDPNHDGQTDLQNIENNFAALKSQFGGLTAPANPVAGMPWVDTTAHILKIRNEANTAWLSIFDLATGKPVGVSTDADTVDGFHASQSVVVNSVAVRDASGNLPGNVLGNAAGLSSVLAVAGGGTGATTAAAAADNLSVVKRDHGYGNVGSLLLAATSTINVAQGATVAGSTLYTHPAEDAKIWQSANVSGTWRCLGKVHCDSWNCFGNTNSTIPMLWQRIS